MKCKDIESKLTRLEIGYLRCALCDAARERQGWIMRLSSEPASTMTQGRMCEIIRMASDAQELLRIIDALDAVPVDCDDENGRKYDVLLPREDAMRVIGALRTATMMARTEAKKMKNAVSDVKIGFYTRMRDYLQWILDDVDDRAEA